MIYRNLWCFYTVAERKIKKTVPSTVAPKRTKSLGIQLIKEVKDLYSANYKTLLMKLKMKLKMTQIARYTILMD